MDYTLIMLASLGGFGILIHNLKNLNSLNRKSEGNLSLVQYLKLEVYSILLSISVVAVALIAQQEIRQLEIVGNYLGLAFVAIGYMAQSIVVSFAGKAEKFIKEKESQMSEAVKILDFETAALIRDEVYKLEEKLPAPIKRKGKPNPKRIYLDE